MRVPWRGHKAVTISLKPMHKPEPPAYPQHPASPSNFAQTKMTRTTQCWTASIDRNISIYLQRIAYDIEHCWLLALRHDRSRLPLLQMPTFRSAFATPRALTQFRALTILATTAASCRPLPFESGPADDVVKGVTQACTQKFMSMVRRGAKPKAPPTAPASEHSSANIPSRSLALQR